MIYAVTGGLGFIGSHLVEELIRTEPGCIVRVFDSKENAVWDFGRSLPPNRSIETYYGSILTPSKLRRVFKEVDTVFHLAAVSSVEEGLRGPARTMRINAVGSVKVLEASRTEGVRRVILASSAAVYPSVQGAVQEHTAPEPGTIYGASKAAMEITAPLFRDLSTVSARLFNVFGPRSDKGVIPAFLKCIRTFQPPVIYGTGSQVRDFISVFDVVKALIFLKDHDYTGPVNIGSGEKMSINQVLEEVRRRVFVKGIVPASPVVKEARTGDLSYSVASIARLRALGFQGTGVDFQSRLAELAKYYLPRP